MSKTWFITGANRGLGREFATAALARGDRVAATSRQLAALSDLAERFGELLLPLALDVTDRAGVFAAVAQAHRQFGQLDVVVNNAGYGLFGAVEELSEQQLRDQMEVNLFGVFHVTQAALPIMRQQGQGHLVQISTVGGVVTFPTLGGYHASKWAVEGLSDALAQEVKTFGIHVTLVEPGPFGTDWAGSSAVRADALPAYAPLHAAVAASSEQLPPSFTGEPAAAGTALLALADAPEPPLRVFFGVMPGHVVPAVYEARLKTWQDWAALSAQANGQRAELT